MIIPSTLQETKFLLPKPALGSRGFYRQRDWGTASSQQRRAARRVEALEARGEAALEVAHRHRARRARGRAHICANLLGWKQILVMH